MEKDILFIFFNLILELLAVSKPKISYLSILIKNLIIILIIFFSK
tara:strand:+ start:63094 stop:63228 length:135 start_codon:yes stop_codon:yes gene_type:complete